MYNIIDKYFYYLLHKEYIMFDFLDIGTLLYRVPALLIALSFHEYAHAAVSDSLGDPTPRAMGRLTVNPMAHLDVLGTILLVLCGFGWAKPVMINPRYYDDYKSGVLKVSFAGPGMNLFLGFLSILLSAILYRLGMLSMESARFLNWIMLYNVWFAFFNLIPVPPLDGFKILSMFLPGELSFKYENFNARYGFILLMVVVFSGFINRIINPLANGFISLCSWLVYLVF